MTTTLSDEALALLAEPRLGHVVTMGADGAPQVTCVWVGWDGTTIGFGTQRGTAKVRNIERDPRVAVSIEGDPAGFLQPHLVVRGAAAVVEVGPDGWLERMDALAAKYVGGEFPSRAGGDDGVWIEITPEKVGGAGV